MTKYVNDSVLNAGLSYVENNSAQLLICSGNPTDRSAALAAALASVGFLAADISQVNGDVSGRKNIYGAKADIPITTTGTANTVCLVSATELLVRTDLTTAQALTSGGTADTPAFDHEIEDAA